ncbi:MAG: DoxX family protein [Actinomycetota bacterium]|nr:DoxX family protein [Actinomycetota bacterium]
MDNEGNGRGRTGRWRRRSPWIVAAAFSISGVVHLVHPTTFTRIVPDFLPARTALVYASGVAELACAAGLWRRARWAGIAAAVLLVAIWPANLQMAINAQHGHVVATKVEDWIRFPLQLPLIWCALQARRR